MANPLANRAPLQRESGHSISLQDHCDKLNQLRWVRASGQPFFVNRRELSTGGTQLFVDR